MLSVLMHRWATGLTGRLSRAASAAEGFFAPNEGEAMDEYKYTSAAMDALDVAADLWYTKLEQKAFEIAQREGRTTIELSDVQWAAKCISPYQPEGWE